MTAAPPDRGGAGIGPATVGHALALAWQAGRYQVLGYGMLALVEAVVPVGAAWLTKLVIDAVTLRSVSGSGLGRIGGGLAAAGLAAALLPHLSGYVRRELDRRIGLLAQDRLFAATERLTGLARFENPAFLDRLSLAAGAGGGTPGMVVAATVAVGNQLITVLAFAGTMLVVSPWLALAVMLAAIPALAAELRLSRHRAAMMWRLSPVERRELFYQRLLTSVPAAKELRLFGIAPYFRALMAGQRREANAQQRRMDRRELGTQSALGLLSAGIAGAGLLWAVFAAWRGELTIGDVSLLVASIAGVQGAVASLVTYLTQAHHQLLLFDHFCSIVASQPDLPVPATPRRAPPLRRGIEVRGVWFRYSPAHGWALRDVHLTIRSGRSLALVGRNGAGKSTLVKLLCRFYDPERGAILWDGVDLREMDPVELRRRIGVAFQDYMEYDLTASDNIGLGDPDRLQDRERIHAAARLAGVHEALTALPRGYDTLLSRSFYGGPGDATDPGADPEVGVILSGGQWQRVALARALLRDERDLLILDEPSAGLDAEAEAEIHTRLAEHRAGRTSVLISHRLGAVRDADQLVVLDQGQVVERGGHDELIAADGVYARLFRLQAGKYQDQPDRAPGPARHPAAP